MHVGIFILSLLFLAAQREAAETIDHASRSSFNQTSTTYDLYVYLSKSIIF